MDVLKNLSRDHLDHREWVALQWVRTYLVFAGNFPDPDLSAEFDRLYSPEERVSIFAVFKLMLFFNMLMNTVAGAKPRE
ncbi:MAG: hypothetical protein AB1724_20160 [Thermodesulfobacteriota bacterium]